MNGKAIVPPGSMLTATMSHDRLAAMEIFVRVVEAGSFSGAAAQLGIGQPAVSKAVAQLEERLGVRLLVRSTRSLSLTEAGRGFHDNARRAIDGVNQAELVARGEAGLTGTLRVSASLCFSRLHLLPRLPEFLAQHPKIDLEVVADDRFVNLADEKVDLALRTGALDDSPVIARKIGQSRLRVIATRGYWEVHGKPKVPTDLLAQAGVILQREGRLVDEWCFRKGALEAPIKLRGRLKVTAGEALRDAVLAGLGCAVASEWLFSPELASGAVESVLDDWELPLKGLWAVFPPGGLVPVKARELVAFVERCMAAPFLPRTALATSPTRPHSLQE